MKVKSIGVATLVAASMAWTPANAADLGGDCCADLEERVAELEATTARKGNRKVSLTISGQVSELVYWWDDGQESNVYVGTNNFSNSRFRFKGDAKISSDWSAGYYIEIQVVSDGLSSSQTENNDDLGGGIGLRHSAWYLKSKTLGSFWVGQHSHATDNIVLFANGGTGVATAANYNVGPGASLAFRDNSLGGFNFNLSTVNSASFLQFLDTDRANVIRYDSPSIAGFVVSASWGEDDMWDVALTYAGEFAGFKVSGGIGYHVERDDTGDNGTANIRLRDIGGANVAMDFEDIRGSISVLHAPSGLFLDFAGIHREFDVAPGVLPGAKSDFNFWMLRGGIYQRFFAIGKTSIFGEYAEASGALEGSAYVDPIVGPVEVFNDKLTLYGVGINQYIDAAAMEIYLGWRHMEADLNVDIGGGFALPLDDIDLVYTGARIQF